MNIVSLSARNFMSFRELDYTFPPNGLVFVGGDITDGQMSISNGAGKSAFFEALAWCLYGKTIRATKSVDDIVNSSIKSDCKVAVEFERGGVLYSVIRYRNDKKFKNTLQFVSGQNDLSAGTIGETQKLIEFTLGISWDVFSAVVIFGEKAQRFVEATDAEKKKVFDEILQFSQYQVALEHVKERLSNLTMTKAIAEGQLNLANAMLTSACGNVESAKRKISELKQEYERVQEDISIKKAELAEKEGRLEKLRSRLSASQQEKDGLDVAFVEIQGVIQESDRKRNAVKMSYATACGEKNQAVSFIKSAKAKLNHKLDDVLNLSTDAACPTCGQMVTKNSVVGISQHYILEIEEMTKQQAEIEAQIEKDTAFYEEQMKPLNDTQSEALRVRADIDSKLTAVKNTIRMLEPEISALSHSVAVSSATLNQNEGAIKAQLKFAEHQLEEFSETRRAAEIDVATKNFELSTLIESGRYLEFWKEGFGNRGIKSFMLDEVIPALNNQLDFFVSTLMGDEFTVAFDTESMLKGGELRDKLDIRISRLAAGPVDYSLLSAGEKRRVDVSILLALQALVFERQATACSLMVLDEVFDSLDKVGIERVVSLLRDIGEKKSVYVISHLNDLQSYFENFLIIKKEGGVSQIAGMAS